VRSLVHAAALLFAAGGTARADDVSFSAALAAVRATPEQQSNVRELESARRGIDGAGGWPATSVNAGTNRLTARAVIGISIPVPIFGTLGAARTEAAAHARVVEAETGLAAREHEQRVALAWLELARADAEVAALEISAQQATDLERIAQGRLDAGAGAEVDVTAAHAATTRARIDLAAAKRTQQAAAAGVAAQLDWDPTRELHASGPLPGGAPAPAPDVSRHPERVAAFARVAEDEAAEQRIAVERRPALALSVETSFADPTQPGVDVFGGVTLELPLFANVGARLESAHAHTLADTLRMRATEGRLRGELVAALHRWQGASERVTSLERDALPAQERDASRAMLADREGARDLSTALLAARDLSVLRAEITSARIDAAKAWVELELARGERPDAP